MSGHSKWSKVKHQKAASDAIKGKLFTKASQAITVALSEGGGITDPAGNFKLRLAIEKARAVNMPKENIDRAIARAVIVARSGGLETILYEGFGPGGTAILIEAATDNRQRTVSAIRNVLETAGGSLGSAGSVGYLFERGDGLVYRPIIRLALSEADTTKLDALVTKLEELDDVQRVFTNMEE
ncbi:YebC/PmpR family DNA-binding transcriptional regulator [Candidatus Gottesmanbacteria bacterium]|nr:YebC/PmpR family DNA-binding transcriptional regulator [Candidatus Gottesmanbacteria bacterium]